MMVDIVMYMVVLMLLALVCGVDHCGGHPGSHDSGYDGGHKVGYVGRYGDAYMMAMVVVKLLVISIADALGVEAPEAHHVLYLILGLLAI